MDRRQFLRLGAGLATTALTLSSPFERALAAVSTGPGPWGPLGPPDANGIQLPEGFRSRVLALGMEPVPGTDHVWHVFPDGGATFPAEGNGWIYVSNSEFFLQGGVGALRFAGDGSVVDAYSICEGTFQNCAGGTTPWSTWLTCEEFPTGHVFECDPTGRAGAQIRPGLGTFQHEAAAVDPATGVVYLTEDQPNGRFYRFVPSAWGRLDSGVLQVCELSPGGDVSWHDVPDPNPPTPRDTPTRLQVAASTAFDGGEGIVWSRGALYFTTKGDNRVWVYVPRKERMEVLYDDDLDPALPLRGVDNITADREGNLVVAEDGGDMELVVVTHDLQVAPLLRVLGQDGSELAGPAFDPSGRRLYVSSQRGNRLGITYEIEGPFLPPKRPRWRRLGLSLMGRR